MVVGALGKELVLDVDSSNARSFILPDSPHDMNGIAVASVAIGNHRDVDCAGYAACNLNLLAHSEQRLSDGLARARDPSANHQAFEALALEQPGGERIPSARGQNRSICLQQRAQTLFLLVHTGSSTSVRSGCSGSIGDPREYHLG